MLLCEQFAQILLVLLLCFLEFGLCFGQSCPQCGEGCCGFFQNVFFHFFDDVFLLLDFDFYHLFELFVLGSLLSQSGCLNGDVCFGLMKGFV